MTFIGQLSEISVLAPFFSLSAATVLLITFHWLRLRAWLISSGLILLISLGWLVILTYGEQMVVWGIRFDNISILGMLLVMPPLVFIMGNASFVATEYDRGANQTLLVLLSGLGALGTIASQNFMMLFVSLQCMTIPIYALLAHEHKDKQAVKGSLQYLVLSGIALAFMLFGILLLYAAFPEIDYFQGSFAVPVEQGSSLLIAQLGIGFLWFGFAFKLGLFPLQYWTPSVYEHAPISSLSLLVIMSKTAILLALMRLWPVMAEVSGDNFGFVPLVMSILSILLGNSLLLKENAIFRWLAYFSVGHIGLVCLVLQSGSELSGSAIFMDLFAFILGGLAVLFTLQTMPSVRFIEDLNGLAKKSPLKAFALSIGLLSFAGVPLTVGFIGKFALIAAIVDKSNPLIVVLVAIGSLIGIAGVFRLLLATLGEGTTFAGRNEQKAGWVSVLLAIAIIVAGIMPNPYLAFISNYLS